MDNQEQNSQFKSPKNKLIKFFQISRNKWKQKYKELKKYSKYLINKIRFLEASKAKWKKESKELEKILKAKEKELQQLKEEKSHSQAKALEKKNLKCTL